jgi:hypothetical protein
MYIDKQTAVRWQINAAIRNIFVGECAVATHVIVQCAREIMQDYARAKHIKLTNDISSVVKPEHIKFFKALLKEHYNYFKHSKDDADDEIEITNVHTLNEGETLMNIGKYAELFNDVTQHMKIFNSYMMIRTPELFRWDEMPLTEQMKSMHASFMKANVGKDRTALCAQYKAIIQADPLVVNEVNEVRSISLAPEHIGDATAPSRDVSKAPYFRRKKQPNKGVMHRAPQQDTVCHRRRCQ